MEQDSMNEMSRDEQRTELRPLELSFVFNSPYLCVAASWAVVEIQQLDVLGKSTVTSENLESRCEALRKAVEEVLTA